jgi:hypothetical protein
MQPGGLLLGPIYAQPIGGSESRRRKGPGGSRSEQTSAAGAAAGTRDGERGTTAFEGLAWLDAVHRRGATDGGAGPVSVPAARENAHHLPDVGRVMAVRALLEVARQRRQRFAEAAHPAEQQATVPSVIRV